MGLFQRSKDSKNHSVEKPKEGNGSRWWLHNNRFTDRNIAQLDRDIIEPSPSPTIFESLTDSEKDDLYTAQRMPSSASEGQANDAVFCNEQVNEDRMGEFVSLLVNSSDLVGDSDTSEEFESDIELSTSLSSDSEQEVEESDIVDDLENDDNE